VQSAVAHWSSLLALLRQVELALLGRVTEYLEIPPCACVSCAKHVQPGASVRLLLFPFVGDVRLSDVVKGRRRKIVADDDDDDNNSSSNNNNNNEPENSNSMYRILTTVPSPRVVPAAPAAQLDAFDRLTVPPPPMVSTTTVSTTTIIDEQVVTRMVKDQIESAVADATRRYAYLLAQSQNEVTALRQQVDQLQRQLAQMSLSSSSPLSAEPFVDPPFEQAFNDTDESYFLSLKPSPPRKRRHQSNASAVQLAASSATALCRESNTMMWSADVMPQPSSPSNLYVY